MKRFEKLAEEQWKILGQPAPFSTFMEGYRTAYRQAIQDAADAANRNVIDCDCPIDLTGAELRAHQMEQESNRTCFAIIADIRELPEGEAEE